MPLVGFAEVIGGVLIILPRTRALGALIIFPVMVGIILMSIFQNTSLSSNCSGFKCRFRLGDVRKQK